MSVQPALVVETIEATEVLEGVAPKPAKGRFRMERVNWPGTIILVALRDHGARPALRHRLDGVQDAGAGRRRQRLLAARAVQRRRASSRRGS